MKPLYELTRELEAVIDAIEGDEQGGLTPPEIAALEAIEGKIEDKLEGIGRVLRNLAAEQDACEAEAKRLSERARRNARAIERIKDYVQFEFDRLGWQKRQVGIFKFAVVRNSQPSVMVLNLDAVPHDFDKPPKRELMLSAIRQAIETGRDVPGVELVQGSHLRVG